MSKLSAAAIFFTAGIAAAGAVCVAASVGLDFSVSSTAHVERLPGNYFSSRVINTRFIPVSTFAEHSVEMWFWLVTVATDVELRTDREPADPDAKVSVIVDDVSTDMPVHLSEFTDPGSDGEVLASRYFSSTLPGCCASPAIHHVRLLSNGKLLFKSTGEGLAGISAWAAIPQTDPTNMRWAAFDGEYTYEQYKKGMRGTIVYGNETGPLSSVVLMATSAPSHDERSGRLENWLPNVGKLYWIDPQEKQVRPEFQVANAGPASGTPTVMKDLALLKGVRDRTRVGGFQIALVLEGETLALVPIEGDDFDLGHAITANDLRLAREAP